MNLSTYDLVASGYDEKINSLTDTLISKFKSAIANNADELIELILRDSFEFISQSGEIIKIIDDKYIFVGKYQNKEIYLSVFARELVYFEENTDIGQIYPVIISIEFLRLMFRDINLFESIMYVAELTGILEKSIEYKGEQLKTLKKYINGEK
jgi:hypothetical protein